jgi:hypothetical protein
MGTRGTQMVVVEESKMLASFARTTSLLSRSEKNRLAELETQINDAFYRAGQALKEIRDSRLYRDNYASFEDYCRDKWDIARNYGNKLIAASEVVKNLSTNGTHTPKSERQARPFTSLPPAQQIDAWQEVVNTAQKGRITTALCEEVAKKYKKMSTTGTQTKTTSRAETSRENLADFQELCMQLSEGKKTDAYIRQSLDDLWIKANKQPETLEVSVIKFQLKMLFYQNEIQAAQIEWLENNLAANPWGFSIS